MRRALLALLLLCAVIGGACGAGVAAPAPAPSPANVRVDPPQTWVDHSPPPVVWPVYGLTPAQVGTGCGKARPETVAEGRSVVRRIVVDGVTREYRLRLPTGVAVDQPLPLLLNFHGRGSNAETQERYSGFAPIAEREKFVLVSPEGTGTPKAWSAGATTGSEVDDVAFVRALVGHLAVELCIDQSRVFAAGFSNGGFMTASIGCGWGDAIAGIAMVGGTGAPPGPCSGRPAVIALHGTADTVVPFGGGLIRGVFPYSGARVAMDSWAALRGCTGTETKRLTKHVVTEERTGCASAVRLVVVEGDGHTWPGASELPAFGTTTRELMAAEAIWAFFKPLRLGR